MNIHNKRKYITFLKFKRNFQQYGLQKARVYELVLHWLHARLSRNQFLILSGILVGLSAGIAGVILKTLVHYIHTIITDKVHFENQILYYLVFPFVGIVLTTLVVIIFFRGKDDKGIGTILIDIAQNSSIISSVKMYSQIIQGAITVGLGGSAGLESPIAVTGAAIGSNYAQRYKLSYKERTLLLAAGATAGIASAFNAPIAGIMFAFEILLTGVVFTDLIPLVVSAICGSLLSMIVLQEDVLFRFYAREAFDYKNTPYFIILGIVCGFYARYFVLVTKMVEHYIKSLKVSRLRKAMLGGAVLSILCVLFPPLFGEGYETVKDFTNVNIQTMIKNSFLGYFEIRQFTIILYLIFVLALKAFATPITIFSGGNGGNFAPSLFSGGTLGYLFALVCQATGLEGVPTTNLVLVGMAGAMSGVMYAPLTAIFLIAESSLSYDLFIPLMIVSVISYLIARWFSPISPDLKSWAEQGKIFTNKYDDNLLFSLKTRDFIDFKSVAISKDISSVELWNILKSTNKTMFAVVNEEKNLMGTFTLDDVRPYLFNSDMYDELSLSKVMTAPATIIHLESSPQEILNIFDATDTWFLPVINRNDEFVGFISKNAILNGYRKLLQLYSN